MPSTLSFASGGSPISAELFEPPGAANGGVVVLVHGSDGMVNNTNGPWATMIREYAQDLAGKGTIALIPHYFERTGTLPGHVDLPAIAEHRDKWQAAVGDALRCATTLPGANASRAGLVGFSLGGHLSLRLRAQVKLLVAFFAPELDGLGGSRTIPLQAQLHHGLDDHLVPFAQNAKPILTTLLSTGASAELFEYAGAGHGFVGDSRANVDARAQSRRRTMTFIAASL